jgi:hypothetical protein
MNVWPNYVENTTSSVCSGPFHKLKESATKLPVVVLKGRLQGGQSDEEKVARISIRKLLRQMSTHGTWGSCSLNWRARKAETRFDGIFTEPTLNPMNHDVWSIVTCEYLKRAQTELLQAQTGVHADMRQDTK